MIPSRFKYVIVDDIRPRLCGPCDQHKDLVHFGEPVTAAGFAKLGYDVETKSFTVTCFGESLSLKARSRGEKDAQLILRMFEEPMW